MVTTSKSTDKRALMAHLMRRAGFGATQAELDVLETKPYDEVVDEILNPGASNHMTDEVVMRYHTEVHEQRGGPWSAKQWLYRMVTTDTPILEKMALFWHGIFATGYAKTNQARALAVQIDMFRRFGLGKFDDLLVELSKDPAMIIWLDNQDNHKDAINENIEVAIFDDGLQDKLLGYNLSFVCFNIQTWLGNSFCIPSGPLREDLKSIKKYDAVFLNGNGENTIEIENILKNIKINF